MKTGEIARLANVSEKTIRYYDRIGLLKPSQVQDNKYRQYSDSDLLKLQRILFLKQLGFPLDEIKVIVSKDEALLDSFNLQKRLLRQKIGYLTEQERALEQICRQAETGTISWQTVSELMKLSTSESLITENYQNADYLGARIALHERFSTNPKSWFSWLADHVDLKGVNRILEVGAGTGKLWKYFNPQVFRNREVFLTDKSQGMTEEIRRRYGSLFNCLRAECESIPFKNDYFDAVIANHVLFYVSDPDQGLSEISRVLRPNGVLYATTYSQDHMKEITEICQQFDPEIILSRTQLASVFGEENGKEILARWFGKVEVFPYQDELRITESGPLLNYILSCHGNQKERLNDRIDEFKDFLSAQIEEKGALAVRKCPVLFICRDPRKTEHELTDRSLLHSTEK